jgi:isoleucyl-tRNA synthetase
VAIICGPTSPPKAGTGLVHTAPAHGADDLSSARNTSLPVNNPVGPMAVSRQYAGAVGWRTGRQDGLGCQPLGAGGTLKLAVALLCQKILQHSYPHCWRHKTPMIFRATTQWFIGMEQSRSESQTLRWIAERAVDDTQFFPAWGRARLEAMMKTRPDWCVSRQRNWGVPMTFFLHKETGAAASAHRPN